MDGTSSGLHECLNCRTRLRSEEEEATMASNSSSFQSLGNGTFRVSGARVSPTTGRYVTGNSGAAAPKQSSNPPKAQPKQK
jgi:hypothetical protein